MSFVHVQHCSSCLLPKKKKKKHCSSCCAPPIKFRTVNERQIDAKLTPSHFVLHFTEQVISSLPISFVTTGKHGRNGS